MWIMLIIELFSEIFKHEQISFNRLRSTTSDQVTQLIKTHHFLNKLLMPCLGLSSVVFQHRLSGSRLYTCTLNCWSSFKQIHCTRNGLSCLELYNQHQPVTYLFCEKVPHKASTKHLLLLFVPQSKISNPLHFFLYLPPPPLWCPPSYGMI